MTSLFVNPKRKQTRLRPAHLAITGLAALIAAGDHAGARSGRSERSVESRSAGDPIMAIVSLRNQLITVYRLARPFEKWPPSLSEARGR